MTWGERWRRWLCRTFGHRWIAEKRAEPVIPVFALCRRCGKFERIIA